MAFSSLGYAAARQTLPDTRPTEHRQMNLGCFGKAEIVRTASAATRYLSRFPCVPALTLPSRLQSLRLSRRQPHQPRNSCVAMELLDRSEQDIGPFCTECVSDERSEFALEIRRLNREIGLRLP